MTRQEYRVITRLLHSAKDVYHVKYGPTPKELERSRQRVMALVSAQGGQTVPKLSFTERFRFNLRFLPTLIPPQFGYVAAVFALVISAVATGYMSRQAMPGDSLYSAKIALEKTQVRFTSNPASRAKAQMELAGRRLAEAEAAPSSPQAAQDALQRFSQDIRVAKETLKQAADPAQRESAAEVITQKALEYEEKLGEVKMNPRRTVNVAASAAIADAEKALEEVKGIETEDSLKEEPVKAEASSGVDGEEELRSGEVGI